MHAMQLVPWLTALLLIGCGGGAVSGPPPAPPPAPAPAAPREAQAAPPPAGPVVLSIVGTNDLHGHAERLPIFAGYVANLRQQRAADGGDVLLVDAGDMFQGTLVSNLGEGESVVLAYNALGYDAATIGNHEFDYGPVGDAPTPQTPNDNPRGALLARVAQANFPILSANILDAQSGHRVQWPGVHASVTVTKAAVPVGIIGVTTEDTLHTTIAANVSDLRMEPIVDAVKAQATALRAAGAKIVVVLAHAGDTATASTIPTTSRPAIRTRRSGRWRTPCQAGSWT